MAMVESIQVPEAFVEVIVYSNEGQCSLVGRRRRALYRSVMQENYRTVSTLGRFPVHTSELLSRLDRGEEAWVPDLQSSEDSADEGPVRPTLKRLPKRGGWWDRNRSPMMYCNSDSSNSDDEPERETEKEKPQRGGPRLTLLHRNILTGSKGSFKPRETYKNWLQLKKWSRNQVIRSNIAEAGDINGSTAKERTWKICSDCGQSFKSGLSLSNHQRIHFREAAYKCSICGERFTAKKVLARHHRRHAEEKGYKHPSNERRALKHPKIASVERPHKCPKCWKCFHLKKHLLQHQRSHEAKGFQRSHATERPHKCSMCGKGFNRKEHLTRHQKIHTRQATDKIPKGQEEAGVETSYGAPEKKSFRAKTRARIVMSDLGDTGSTDLYKCKFCGKSLRAKIMLIEHERTHTEKRPYKCSLCKKSFFYKQNLQNHEKTHRIQTDYKHSKRVKRLGTRNFGMSRTAEHPSRCHIARKVITRSLCLTQHQKIHVGKKLHKCQYCGKCLSSKDGLANHERIHRGERPFRCDECGNCFRQKCHLSRHLETHAKQKPFLNTEHARLKVKGPLTMPNRINKGWKPYKGLTLRNATRILHVTRHQNMPTENSLFKCQYCGKCTQTKTSLLSHERIHKGRKPYQCSECGKKFSQKNYLGCHLRGHLRKKFSKRSDPDKKLTTKYSPLTLRKREKLSLICHKCGKCFSESYHLKRHQKIHSGTKPFSCATCGKGFIQTWHLRRHEKIHLKLTHRKQSKVNCVFSRSTNVAGNFKPQVASRTMKRKTSLNEKEGKTGPLAALMERSEIRASQSSKREETHMNAQADMQVFLSKKSKGKAQQNQRVVRQFNMTKKDNALQHFKQDEHSQCQLIQPRECSRKAHVLPSCRKKKGFACQQLGSQMITRTSKRENQLAGKQTRSCFCQLEKPEITPGTKSKNPQTCRKTCKSLQKKPHMTISSQSPKNAPKFCKPISPCLDQPSQSTFLPELLAANELKSSALQNLGAVSFSQQKQKRFLLMKVNRTSLTSDKATPEDLKRGRESQRTILTRQKLQTRASKKRDITDQDRSEQIQVKHICSVCKKSFRNLGNLLIHEKNHKGDRPFLCMYCGKTFYNISTLRVHVRIHTGEKPFKCSECPFRCNVSSNLSRHKRTHVRERPYPCLHCGKRFWLSHTLLIHSRTHKKELHTCCDCGRVFQYENFLKLHRRYKHLSEVELPHSGEK